MISVKLNRTPFDKNLSHYVDGFLNELPALFKNDFNGIETKNSAPVNVKETENSFQLEVIAPGFEKTDFTINLDQNLLTIAAEKKNEVKEDNTKAETGKEIRNEYTYRSFKRTFTLNEKIDATAIEASYVNGVLTLNLPKKAEVKAAVKEISIK
jgi:HSP20 family protein